MSNKNFVEEVWFVFGFKIGKWVIGYLEYQNYGEACSVKFNTKKAFFGKKESKKFNSNLIGFYHSHPGGDTYPSNQDNETMDTWVKATGKPLICGIFSNGEQKCFLYNRVEPKSSKTGFIQIFPKFFMGNKIFIITNF